jgi:hypothetical protein
VRVCRRLGPLRLTLHGGRSRGRPHLAWGDVGVWVTPLPHGLQVELSAFVGDRGVGLSVTARLPLSRAAWQRLRRAARGRWWGPVGVSWLCDVGVGARWHRWLYCDLDLGPVAVHTNGPVLRMGMEASSHAL